MTTNIQNPSKEYDLLCNELPKNVAQAIEMCALPHALTDALGYEIIHGFAKFNGTARAVWAELKQLPFVYPYEDDQYRFEQPARAHFVSKLEQRNGTFLELNNYLQEYFSAERKQVTTPDAPQARELDWRIAYHLAPVSPKKSVERLMELGEKAARSNQMSDVKSVIDIFEEQTRWLSDYGVERAYFEGRYAYARRDFKVAESKFDLVWNQGQNNMLKAISGHLLGIIWAKKSEQQWLRRAEKVLRESLDIEITIGHREGESMVLTTLGDVLVDLGGRKNLEEAEQCYRRSLEIGEKLGLDHHIAMVLNSLGGVLVKLGGRERLEEAERYYHRSLEIGERLGLQSHQAKVLTSLGDVLVKLGGRKHLDEAERHYRRSLELEKILGNSRGEAMVLTSLGGVLVKLGDHARLEEAERQYRRSLEIDLSSGNRRGQAMTLNSLGDVLVKLGTRERLEEAERYYHRSIELKKSLGDRHGQAMTLNSLGGVLVKLGGRERLEEAEQYYHHSREIKQNLGDRRGEAMVLSGLATLAEISGDIKLACQYTEKIIEINSQLGDQHFVNISRERLKKLQQRL
jgi:tetratricopeptide (TPR) repeat protein